MFWHLLIREAVFDQPVAVGVLGRPLLTSREAVSDQKHCVRLYRYNMFNPVPPSFASRKETQLENLRKPDDLLLFIIYQVLHNGTGCYQGEKIQLETRHRKHSQVSTP